MRTQYILSSFDSTLNDLRIFHSVTLFEDSCMDADRLLGQHPHQPLGTPDKKMSIGNPYERAIQPAELPGQPAVLLLLERLLLLTSTMNKTRSETSGSSSSRTPPLCIDCTTTPRHTRILERVKAPRVDHPKV